jgi:hypothetical protein
MLVLAAARSLGGTQASNLAARQGRLATPPLANAVAYLAVRD